LPRDGSVAYNFLPIIKALYAKGELQMNINATLLIEIVLISIVVIGILSFYLGKRKTNSPKIVALVGVLLSTIPPLGLIYLAVLVLKNDINQNSTSEVVG